MNVVMNATVATTGGVYEAGRTYNLPAPEAARMLRRGVARRPGQPAPEPEATGASTAAGEEEAPAEANEEEATPDTPAEELLTADELAELSWNDARSYVGELDLSYRNKAELVEAYAAYLESREG